MDKETDDLIAHICTRIGMTMEDACVVALAIGRLNETERSDALDELNSASQRISALVAAARELNR